VTQPRLLKYYRRLPQPEHVLDADLWDGDLGGDDRAGGELAKAVERFRRQVEKWYTEATLGRLLDSGDPEVRRAAVTALSLVGGMNVNAALAARLTDKDEQVRKLASEALWAVWFRGVDESQGQRLQEVLSQPNPRLAIRALDELLRETTDYAEAYNQRAVLYYRIKEYHKAIQDCERALRLNPHHFGAAAGMAQCYVRLKKPRAALRAFRNAYRINPNLDDVRDAIKSLEEVLGDGSS
jgi:tetratricopeptide (TPR) repeat protein